jgi:hypothetical protein
VISEVGLPVQFSKKLVPLVVLDIRRENASALPPDLEPAGDIAKTRGQSESERLGIMQHRKLWLQCSADTAAAAVKKQSAWLANFPSGPEYPNSGKLIIVLTESKARPFVWRQDTRENCVN